MVRRGAHDSPPSILMVRAEINTIFIRSVLRCPESMSEKTANSLYSEATLLKALKALKKDGRKIRQLGRSFGIPESTLRKQLLLNRSQVPGLGRKSVFHHILRMI